MFNNQAFRWENGWEKYSDKSSNFTEQFLKNLCFTGGERYINNNFYRLI